MIKVDDEQGQWTFVVCRTGDFAIDQLQELASVVQVGQRIGSRQLVQLLVVAGLDRGAIHELEDATAHRDVVAILELGLDDRLVVEERLVGRIEILDAVAGGITGDPAMCPRHAALDDLEPGFGCTADDQRLIAEIDALPEPLALQHDQACGHFASPDPSVRVHRAALRGAGIVAASGHAPQAGCRRLLPWQSLRDQSGLLRRIALKPVPLPTEAGKYPPRGETGGAGVRAGAGDCGAAPGLRP